MWVMAWDLPLVRMEAFIFLLCIGRAPQVRTVGRGAGKSCRSTINRFLSIRLETGIIFNWDLELRASPIPFFSGCPTDQRQKGPYQKPITNPILYYIRM